MPNDEPSAPEETSSVPAEENLLQDPEQALAPQELIEGSAFACKYSIGGCQDPVEGLCPTCHQGFCSKHASEIDPQYCSDCLSPATTATQEAPLVDTEGVTHNGRGITLVGPAFKTTGQRIVEMTDNQLGSHIEYMKGRVKLLHSALEYSRIDLSMAELESEERQEKLRRRLRGVKFTSTGTKVGGASGSKSNGEAKAAKGSAPLDPLSAIAKALLGKEVSPQAAKEMFAKIAQAAKEYQASKGTKK